MGAGEAGGKGEHGGRSAGERPSEEMRHLRRFPGCDASSGEKAPAYRRLSREAPIQDVEKRQVSGGKVTRRFGAGVPRRWNDLKAAQSHSVRSTVAELAGPR
jgi:hypothetical protein